MLYDIWTEWVCTLREKVAHVRNYEINYIKTKCVIYGVSLRYSNTYVSQSDGSTFLRLVRTEKIFPEVTESARDRRPYIILSIVYVLIFLRIGRNNELYYSYLQSTCMKRRTYLTWQLFSAYHHKISLILGTKMNHWGKLVQSQILRNTR